MSASLKVLCYPEESLRNIARLLTPDEIKEGIADGMDLRKLVRDMIVTMRSSRGIGLAAPQVGVGLRLFVYIIGTPALSFVIFNPELSDYEGEVEAGEGCLSLPNVNAVVKRAERVTLSGYDLDGTSKAITAKGLLARVIQHETDHLNGILFVDSITPAEKFKIRRGLALLKDDHDFLNRRN